MTAIIILLTLIFILLLVFGFAAFLAWQKLSIFLTYNTKYDSAAYQQAVTTPPKKPFMPPSITEKKGRGVQQVPDLVDITDMPFEEGFKAIAEIGEEIA